ncbi:MAG: BMP family ABC transporter substrate-binding protein [Anaerolineae bacterium]
MKRILWPALAGLLALSMILGACTPAAPTSAPTPTAAPTLAPITEATTPPTVEAPATFKIAFVYIGPPGDLGWTYEHDRGRRMLAEEFGDKVEIATIESVPEGPDAARVIRQYAEQGYNMIFTTSFGYMDPTIEVAKEFPNVYFEHCSGYKTADNVSTYFGKIEQPRYLSGLVAGKMTKANVIGYVAAFPIPEVIRGINSFTRGVRMVNPEAEVRVVWTNTWYDPVKEREAAVALLDQGCDIIAQHQDTTEPQKAAQERGKLSIGYDSDMAKFVGDTVLTSPVWNWGVYYIQTVKAAMDGTWKTHQYWGDMKDGVVELAGLSPKVPDDVKQLVEAEKAKILAGGWDWHYGPLADQDGKVRVAEGQRLTDEEILNMNWFIEGVVGTIPAQ